MNILDIFSLVGSNIWIYGGAFLLVLSILVFVHEWGHYIVARMCGIKVEVFSIGFGPELFGWTDKTGTRWKFSLIPLGGYVKMFGDVDPASAGHDDSVEDDKGETRAMTAAEREEAFFSKPVWKRALVVAAGPGINYLFAFILMTGLFIFNGKPVTPPAAGAVIVGSAADKAGFLPQDLVKSIDGEIVRDFSDVRRSMLVGLDVEKSFIVERDGKEIELKATPERVEDTDRFGFSHTRGILGLLSPKGGLDLYSITEIDGRGFSDVQAVRRGLLQYVGRPVLIRVDTSLIGRKVNEDGSLAEIEALSEEEGGTTVDASERFKDYVVKPMSIPTLDNENPNAMDGRVLELAQDLDRAIIKFGPVEATVMALRESWSITTSTLEAIGQIVVGTRSTKELGGIVRIGALAGDMAQQGLIAMILFTALLSINLGLINLFPIPLLDGGHLVFYFFEALLGKPVPEKVQEYAFRAGFVFLIGLMAFANLNDIRQLILKT